MPRLVCALLAAVLSLMPALPARAAGDASDVVIDVVDAANGAPLGLARVLLQGEAGAIGYTDAEGHARFESVATGSYRASVAKRGFVAARSPLFDVNANRTSTVRVRLQRVGLPQIGSVSVSSSPARASREVGQDDALRFLDGSLRDALGDLPGVTSDGAGLMIDGNDASQTGTSVDGVAIPGAGGSLGGRGINADLFGGAGVSSGARNGALGGSVNFRTLQPTRLPQQQATLAYGSDNSSSALVIARGSLRNLGYVFEHAERGRTSPFTGLDFADETGTSYRHDGDSATSGDLAKLRWAPSIAQTLTFTASATNGENGIVCAQLSARLPCGFGLGAFEHSRSGLMTLSENATIGATTIGVSGFVSTSNDASAEPNAALAGVAAAQSSAGNSIARGFQVGVQLPGGDRHDVSLTAQSYGLRFAAGTTTSLGTLPFVQNATFHGASLIDRYHLGQQVTVTGNAGVNGGNGSNAFASGLDVRWQPARSLAYDVGASAGNAGAGIVLSNAALPDPRTLTFDCANGLAYGSILPSNAAQQRSSSLRASVERSGRRGRLALTAWTARLQNAPVLTAVDAATLALPPGYFAAVGAFASSPFVCGSPAIGSVAFTSFQPADQLSRGATLAGTLEIGKALLAGFATVQSRFVTNGTPATAMLSPVGMQVPGTPLHRVGLVATTKVGKAVDFLANLNYTGANNPNRLPAYTIFNAGFATPLRVGSLALVGTNLGNAHPGPFVPFADVVAFARAGAPPLALAATPLAARAVALTYTVRVGRLGATGSGAGTTEATADPQGETVSIKIRLEEMHEGPHPDALQIDPDNDGCTPAAARIAQPAMDAIGRIAAGAERAKANGVYPASVPGGIANVGAVLLNYVVYDNGARFAVTVGGPIAASAAFLNCARMSSAPPEDRAKFHLYLPPAGVARSAFFIAYAPAVGIYLIPSEMPGGKRATITATSDAEPPSPPSSPFAYRDTCPSSSRPVADAVVAAVRGARAAQGSGAAAQQAEVADVLAKGSGAQSWVEITPHDMLAGAAIVQCLHVAAVVPPHLAAAGIGDVRRPGSLGFADRFGFYTIDRPDQPRPAPSPSPGAPAP